MHSEKTCDSNYNDHHANRVENTHFFSPVAAIERSYKAKSLQHYFGGNPTLGYKLCLPAEGTWVTDHVVGSEST